MYEGLDDFEIEMIKMGGQIKDCFVSFRGIVCETVQDWNYVKERFGINEFKKW